MSATAALIQPSVTVESAMRVGGLRLLGPGARCSDFDRLRQQQEPSLVPAAAPFDPLSLPPLQQAALLQMHESHVKRSLIRELLEDCQDKPATSDYRALSDLGLCERNVGKRYHDLTGEGREAARALEQSLCKQLDVHLLMGPFGSGPSVRFSCPCGWSVMVKNSSTAAGNARSSFNRHHATAEGMQKLVVALKPPGMRAEG